MPAPMTMPRPPIEIETGPQPTAAFIIMHGLGADATDFIPFVKELDLSSVGPVRFVFPYAPVIPVTVNGGYAMPAWYDILDVDINKREDEASLRAAMQLVQGVIADQIARGIAPERIVLGGFSQGCAMALMTGVRSDKRLAGIVGLSGYLPLAQSTAGEHHPASLATPVFMASGEYDSVVRMDRSVASRETLEQLGYEVSWHTYPMEHAVCGQEVADLNAWLLKVL